MHHELEEKEMDALLESQLYGHLGCTLPDGRLYVIPVTYAYHDGAIYSFAYEGQKIDALRRNPAVCFQAEDIVNEGEWRSVIVWGTYEELTGEEQVVAMKVLLERLDLEQGTAISPLYMKPDDTEDAIFYRIRIQQRTGRHLRYD